MVEMKLSSAIKLDLVTQQEFKEVPEKLPFTSLVKYLYKHGKGYKDSRYKAMDTIWFVKAFKNKKIFKLQTKSLKS